ncbi:TIGR03751 family conjugal transfer lipoprotein [Sedimenticola selenatireducens]|uniref:TIGR03751 family conjugal transfer lipoprotein n=1 Tax=Sedimenticola selenatireducens TaxID=191960 RepID=A0A2N6CW29_9GAMM|nr:TIGR03751 family conjugal transfer lipoprotein [Sedimenticola selenatireducens]PLX61424.1 MAG: TIGR03751 family conjugal transfer lipoprotein [Sedimenticola selenatireducens]
MHKPSILITVLGWISLVLGGCASTKDAVLPQDGPSMQTIYQQHIQEMGARDPLTLHETLGGSPVVDADGSLHGYTREAYDEIDVIFPRLPNPTLVMYLFPHLAGEESAPVPGYVTTFPLYERIEYALPGEVPARRQR